MGEREYRFNKDDVAREYDPFSGDVKALIFSMICRVPKEDTWCCTSGQLMFCHG